MSRARWRRLLRHVLAGRLWSHQDFLRLWLGQTISMFGTQITQLALPTLAIVAFAASPLQIGVLQSLQYLPFLLLGLVVGTWADRWRRRPLMIAANLGRFVVLGSIPVAFVARLLTLNQLFVVSAVSGVFTVVFLIAYQSSLPDVVEPDDLVEGNTKLQLSLSAASVVGPSVAGVLIQAIGASLAIAFDAVSFLASAAGIAAMRRPEPSRAAGAARTTFLQDIAGGLQVSFRNPVLRRTIPLNALLHFGYYMSYAVLLIFAYRDLHLTPREVGVSYGLGGLGWLVGAMLTPAVSRRLGIGATLAVSNTMMAAGLLGFVLAGRWLPFVTLSVAQVLIGIFWPMFSVTESTLRQTTIARDLQGRTTGVVRTLVLGVAPPAASIAGGVLATALTVRATLVLGGVVALAGVLCILPPRSLERHVLPRPDATPAVGG